MFRSFKFLVGEVGSEEGTRMVLHNFILPSEHIPGFLEDQNFSSLSTKKRLGFMFVHSITIWRLFFQSRQISKRVKNECQIPNF